MLKELLKRIVETGDRDIYYDMGFDQGEATTTSSGVQAHQEALAELRDYLKSDKEVKSTDLVGNTLDLSCYVTVKLDLSVVPTEGQDPGEIDIQGLLQDNLGLECFMSLDAIEEVAGYSMDFDGVTEIDVIEI